MNIIKKYKELFQNNILSKLIKIIKIIKNIEISPTGDILIELTGGIMVVSNNHQIFYSKKDTIIQSNTINLNPGINFNKHKNINKIITIAKYNRRNAMIQADNAIESYHKKYNQITIPKIN